MFVVVFFDCITIWRASSTSSVCRIINTSFKWTTEEEKRLVIKQHYKFLITVIFFHFLFSRLSSIFNAFFFLLNNIQIWIYSFSTTFNLFYHYGRISDSHIALIFNRSNIFFLWADRERSDFKCSIMELPSPYLLLKPLCWLRNSSILTLDRQPDRSSDRFFSIIKISSLLQLHWAERHKDRFQKV